MDTNISPQEVAKVENGILIDQHGESQYDADGVKNALMNLRELIRRIALDCKNSNISIDSYESGQYILNWLIEDVELKDIRA